MQPFCSLLVKSQSCQTAPPGAQRANQSVFKRSHPISEGDHCEINLLFVLNPKVSAANSISMSFAISCRDRLKRLFKTQDNLKNGHNVTTGRIDSS